jgi:hypothetical protein
MWKPCACSWMRNENRKREPCETVEVGALGMYDRPQPTTANYDQLLGNHSVSEVIP